MNAALQSFASISEQTRREAELMSDYASKKLYHELGRSFLAAAFDCSTASAALREAFSGFILPIVQKLSPLDTARAAVHIARGLGGGVESLAFVDNVLTAFVQSIPTATQAHILVKTERARILLRTSDATGAKTEVDALRTALEGIPLPDSDVTSAVYLVSSELSKSAGRSGDFYREALKFLAHSQGGKSLGERALNDMALDLAIAAMISDDVFNFGELVTSPIFAVLQKEHAAVTEVLLSFDRGALDAFSQGLARVSSSGDRRVTEQISARAEHLMAKAKIMSFLELVFSRPPHERTVTFADIASRCSLRKEEVEDMVMKTLAKGLIKGSIDQVDETVNVTWIQPRVLSTKEITSFISQIDSWSKRATDTIALMAKQNQDLMTIG